MDLPLVQVVQVDQVGEEEDNESGPRWTLVTASGSTASQLTPLQLSKSKVLKASIESQHGAMSELSMGDVDARTLRLFASFFRIEQHANLFQDQQRLSFQLEQQLPAVVDAPEIPYDALTMLETELVSEEEQSWFQSVIQIGNPIVPGQLYSLAFEYDVPLMERIFVLDLACRTRKTSIHCQQSLNVYRAPFEAENRICYLSAAYFVIVIASFVGGIKQFCDTKDDSDLSPAAIRTALGVSISSGLTLMGWLVRMGRWTRVHAHKQSTLAIFRGFTNLDVMTDYEVLMLCSFVWDCVFTIILLVHAVRWQQLSWWLIACALPIQYLLLACCRFLEVQLPLESMLGPSEAIERLMKPNSNHYGCFPPEYLDALRQRFPREAAPPVIRDTYIIRDHFGPW